MSLNADFADRLLAWFDQAGRHDLPWQQNPTAYRVWVSEVMLQQTQVATVMGYFDRFMARFPRLSDLAAAPLDEVLHLWTGLGYYARARSLHRAAQQCVLLHDGDLPHGVEALMTLPGIGRSTAGAIHALAQNGYAPILDGNVKRVLGRHQAIPGAVSRAAVQKQYWTVAEAFTPHHRTAAYTQAMMDLGATCCTRSAPACERCPVASDCQARALGTPLRFPERTARAPVPTRQAHWLIIHRVSGEVALSPRPTEGLWGGLWSFPESAEAPSHAQPLPLVQHRFTHFVLEATPWWVPEAQAPVLSSDVRWVDPRALPAWGFPQPVLRVLQALPQLNASLELLA